MPLYGPLCVCVRAHFNCPVIICIGIPTNVSNCGHVMNYITVTKYSSVLFLNGILCGYGYIIKLDSCSVTDEFKEAVKVGLKLGKLKLIVTDTKVHVYTVSMHVINCT